MRNAAQGPAQGTRAEHIEPSPVHVPCAHIEPSPVRTSKTRRGLIRKSTKQHKRYADNTRCYLRRLRNTSDSYSKTES